MIRLRLDFAYDGTDFHGWARQLGLRTVQGALEETIARVLRTEQPLRLTVAGRTDTGVHASHQVAHLDVEPAVLDQARGHLGLSPVAALTYRLRHLLPPDIVLHSITQAPEGFDARFSALERTYVYRLSDQLAAADPRTRHFVLQLDQQLDETLLNQAATLAVGLKDFGSFATPNPGGTTIREVKTARWRRLADSSRQQYAIAETTGPSGTFNVIEPVAPISFGTLEFTIVADAFAHNMVRSLVGAQVQVGLGKKSLDWFAQKLAVPQREGATGPISPVGLSLERVAYPPDEELAARAEAIRARRVLE